MGDFIFKIKGPQRELEIQVPFSTGITDAVDLFKQMTAKPEPPKKWYQKRKKDEEQQPSVITAAAMTALSVILASNNTK